jgi:hypothetical protein
MRADCAMLWSEARPDITKEISMRRLFVIVSALLFVLPFMGQETSARASLARESSSQEERRVAAANASGRTWRAAVQCAQAKS